MFRKTWALALAWVTILSPCSQGWAQQSEFSVYCNSNMDGTGDCSRNDNNELLACIVIPGGIIECKDKQKLRYECVNYGVTTANSTQFSFSCTPKLSNKISGEIFEDSTNDAGVTGQKQIKLQTFDNKQLKPIPSETSASDSKQKTITPSTRNPFTEEKGIF